MDSKIDIKAVILVLRHTVGVIFLIDEQCLIVDINSDDEISVLNAIYIQMVVVMTTPVESANSPNEYM